MVQEVTVVFDIGRKYKKYFLFDKQTRLIHSYQEILPLILDEDGFPCDDINLISDWVIHQWQQLRNNPEYRITGLNATAYGAAMVHLDQENKPLTPLYSPFKAFPPAITQRFYDQYGEPEKLALQTGSPAMGMLNSGLQMFKIKYMQPALFRKIKLSMHLPQYIIYLITGRSASEYTTLGSHSMLWNYEMMDYHDWIRKEGFDKLMPPVLAANSFIHREGKDNILSGFGLHSACSALIPYRKSERNPFILISAGTWFVNFNLFNTRTLTTGQLNKDCQHYMTPEGSGVKASRVYLGGEHDYQTKRIAQYFKLKDDFYKSVTYNADILQHPAPDFIPSLINKTGCEPFKNRSEWMVSAFANAACAYHHLLDGLSDLLIGSLDMIQAKEIPLIYMDGGFSSNEIFCNILAEKLDGQTLSIPDSSYATALGAAIHITRPAKVCYSENIRSVKIDETNLREV